MYICPLYCRHGNHNILSCLIEGIGRYSGTAIIGPKLEFSDGMVQTGCGREMSVCEVILDLLLPGRVKSKLFKSDMHGKLAREVDWVSGACMLGKRQVLQDLGGFDENIFMYSADVDLCLRVRRQGNKVLYDPTATVIHDGGKSQKKNRSIALRANIASRIYFGKKYYSPFNYFIFIGFHRNLFTGEVFNLPFAELDGIGAKSAAGGLLES